MTDETKILKSNTFEEWRHKTNEISFDVGANSELSDRLTNKLFSYEDVSGSGQSIITGSDDSATSQTLEFELLPDTTLDNTSGYIILAHGTSLTSVLNGNTLSQSGGFSADIISSITIDGKPKILIRNANGTFNDSQNITTGSVTISSSNIIRLVTESYKVGSVIVKTIANDNTVTVRNNDLTSAGYHTPTVSGRINLDTTESLSSRENAVDVFVEGEIIYQHSGGYLGSLSNIEGSASFYATVYHASPTTIYVKTHSGSFNSSLGLKLLNYDQGSGQQISNTLLDSFNAYATTQGHFIEFNSPVTQNHDVTVSARDLVTVANELQTDIGKIEDLTTDGADITLSINELEDAVRGNKTDYVLATDSTEGLVGGVNELELAARGDRSATNYTITTESTEGFVGGINELDTALRSATMQTNNASVATTLTTTASDITSAINEHDTELGTITALHMGTTASNVGDAIAEIEGQIGTESISGIDSGDTDNTIYGALNQLHTEIGDVDITSIDSDTNNITGALVQLHDEVGNVGSGLNGLAATNLTAAVDELRTDIGNVGDSGATLTTGTNIVATDLTAAVVELDTTIGSGVITGTDTEAAGQSNLTNAINAIDAGLGHASTYNDGHYGATTVASTLGKLQDGLLRNDDEIYNIMQAIDGDRPGTIHLAAGTTIPTAFEDGATVTQSGGFTATIATNGIDDVNKTITVRDITGTFSAAENLTTDGTSILAPKVIRMGLVDSTIGVSGLSADNVRDALKEIIDTEIIAGDGLSGAGNLSQDRTVNVDLATGGGLTIVTADSTSIPTNSASSWTGHTEVFLISNGGEGAKQYGFNPNGSGSLSTPVRNDQKFTFDSSGVLSLAPNTSIYALDNLRDNNQNLIAQNNAETDGGAYMKFNTFLEDLTWHGRTITLTGDVTNYSVDSRYEVEVFIKYLLKVDNGPDQDPDYNFAESQQAKASLKASDGDLTDGSFSITLAIPNRTDPNLQGAEPIPQIGFVFKGINAKAGTSFANGDIDVENLTASISAAAGGGQLSVDTGIVRKVSNTTQTFDSDIQFSSGNTVTFGAGSTLDVGSGSIIIGGGGELDVSFDTAFLGLGSGAANQGIRVDRSQDTMGDIYTALEPSESTVRAAGQNADLVWKEGEVIANNGHRAWQLKGLTSGETPSANTAAITTFYNLYEALADSTEIDLIWDSANQRFSAELLGSGISTNAGWGENDVTQTYGSTTGIPQITVDSKGRITDVNIQSISTTMTVNADTGDARSVDLTSDVFKITGTTNEITTAILADDEQADPSERDTIQIGLPDNVTISSDLTVSGTTAASSSSTGALTVAGGAGITGNLYVGGNLQVDGTQTIFNTETITVDDNIIVLNDNKTGEAGTEKAGIEIERGDDANVQLRWNDGTDVWELTVDGTNYSTIITEATDYDDWVLASGTTAGTATISDGNTVTFSAGSGLITSRSDKTITYTHADTSTLTGQQGNDANTGNSDNGKVIQSITVDGFGHVTDVADMNLDNRYIRSFDVRDGDGTEKVITQNEVFKFKELTGDGASIDIDFQTDGTIGEDPDDQVSHILGFKITNDDKGSSQNIYKNFNVAAAIPADPAHTFAASGTAAAGSNADTINFYPSDGIEIKIDAPNDAIRIKNTSLGSNENIFKNIQLFEPGADGTQIGADISASSNTDTLIFKEVQTDTTDGIVLSRLGDKTIGIAHADTSTNVTDIAVDNSGNKVIQDISLSFDTYGHVTGASTTSKTIASPSNGVLTLAAGTALHINEDDKTFSANQSGDQTITFDHDTISRTNTTATKTLSASGTFTAITSLTSNTQGHITAAETKTYTLPSDTNTNKLTTFNVIDGDGTSLTIAHGDHWKFIEGNEIDINWSDDSHGTADDPFDLTIKHDDVALTAGTSTSSPGSAGTFSALASITVNARGHVTATDTVTVTMPSVPGEATSSVYGTVKTGYTANSKNYPVKLSSGKMYVNVPWSNTQNTYERSDFINQAVNNNSNVHFEGLMVGQTTGAAANTIKSVGDIIAYASDDRLKNRIGNIENALDKVNKLNGFTFTANEIAVGLGVEQNTDDVRVGVSAQEVEAVLPEAVRDAPVKNDEGYKTVQYEKMVPLLVEAIKELTEQNKQLCADLEELKNINSK